MVNSRGDCDVPVELYSYGEPGLDDFSVAAFQKRNLYSNLLGFMFMFTIVANAM